MGERVDLEREQRFLAAHTAAHDRIYRYFRRRTDGAATAEDLCAEVFRIVWEKSGHGDDLSTIPRVFPGNGLRLIKWAPKNPRPE